MQAKGKFITAAFWNSHVHLIGNEWEDAKHRSPEIQKALEEMLTSRGFTHAFDLAQLDFSNLNDIRNLISRGKMKGPDIFAIGVPITPGSPAYILPLKLPELSTASEFEHHIQMQVNAGANGIKLWTGSPTIDGVKYMPDSLISAATSLAEKYKIPVFAHPTDNEGVRRAVRNGVSVLAHPALDYRTGWERGLIDTMVRRGVAMIPTLQLCAWELKKENIFNDNHPLLKNAVEQVAAFHKAGGTLLFGTDVGYVTDKNPSEEYTLLQRAGLSFNDILASLTTNPARCFGMAKILGEVREGFTADLLIFDEDPKNDIRMLSNPEYVIHIGRIIYERAGNRN